MKVEHWDGDHLCGDTGFIDTDYTPEEVFESYKNDRGIPTVMWGAYTFLIVDVVWADPIKKDKIKVCLQ